MPKKNLLQKIDEESGLTTEERIINFCEIPRGKKEITLMLGMSVLNCTGVWRNYLQPLINSGKLKMTLPNDRASKNQRFVSGDVAVPTEDEILRFCDTPRTRKEINEHFNLTAWTTWTQIAPLTESGKLKLLYPNRGKNIERQKYTTQESAIPVFTDDTLKSFCQTPRSRMEIIRHFDLEPQWGRRMITIKASENILQRTIPDKSDSPSQRFVATMS